MWVDDQQEQDHKTGHPGDKEAQSWVVAHDRYRVPEVDGEHPLPELRELEQEAVF